MGQFLPILIIGGSFSFVAAILYGAWLLGRYRGREDELPADIANLEARVIRVEVAIGQMTNALERLEAVHRHTVRLITEIPDAAKLPVRVVTPH
jgi:hypothetical protein